VIGAHGEQHPIGAASRVTRGRALKLQAAGRKSVGTIAVPSDEHGRSPHARRARLDGFEPSTSPMLRTRRLRSTVGYGRLGLTQRVVGRNQSLNFCGARRASAEVRDVVSRASHDDELRGHFLPLERPPARRWRVTPLPMNGQGTPHGTRLRQRWVGGRREVARAAARSPSGAARGAGAFTLATRASRRRDSPGRT